MSRIGKLPVSLPTGVSVELLDGNVLKVKGPHGEMCQKVDPDIKMVVGVSEQFTTTQELVGVGYRVAVDGQLLTFSLGYSHEIQMLLPKEVTATVPDIRKGENPKLVLKSCDKQLLGQVAAKIRSFRKPEPYKGKGIKFVGETLRRKAGKTAAAK